MLHLIGTAHIQRLRELSRQFDEARPFRHVVMDDFLDPLFCGRLMDEFPKFDPRWALNETGEVGRKCAIPNIRRMGPAFRDFDRLMHDREFLRFTGTIAGIEHLLYDPDYVGGGTHENLEGQSLDLHVDFNFHPRRPWRRRLNLIVFLNPEWSESFGGCLELHRNPWDPSEIERIKVVPQANRAVLFETTESSWHGFTRIALPAERNDSSRRSLAVYFYTRTRPDERTIAPHATVYVPAPLPAHFETGYTLQPDDVETLQVLLERRNAQIRFLHERELGFSRAIADITGSASFRLARLFTSPIRLLRERLRGQRSQ